MKRKILIFTGIFLAVLFTVCIGNSMDNKSSDKIQLSEPDTEGAESLEKVLAERRSVRKFTDKPVFEKELAQLLWAGQGITASERGFRTAPSAGALYPLKLFAVNKDGVFEYSPEGHNLVQRIDRDIQDALSKAALGQSSVRQAAVNIVIAGAESKLAIKYHRKAKRYMLLEAGHAAQNILLQATALDLGAVPVGAFLIQSVDSLLKLPDAYEPLYIIAVGHKTD